MPRLRWDLKNRVSGNVAGRTLARLRECPASSFFYLSQRQSLCGAPRCIRMVFEVVQYQREIRNPNLEIRNKFKTRNSNEPNHVGVPVSNLRILTFEFVSYSA